MGKKSVNRIAYLCLCIIVTTWSNIACQEQKRIEIPNKNFNIAIDHDSVLNITYKNGEPINPGSYVVYTQDRKEDGWVQFQINDSNNADGLVKFYTLGQILFKQFVVKEGILVNMNIYDQQNGRLTDSLYFAIAEIPVFEDEIPVWKSLRTQHRITYFNSTLNTHEILHNQNIVLKTTYERSRKNLEICNSIYKKVFYDDGTVSSIKTFDWKTKQQKYEQFNKQGVKVIEIVQSDLKSERMPYKESNAQRAPGPADYYKKTIYHENGKPQEISFYRDGTVTTSYYDDFAKVIRKTTKKYDTLPRADIM